ncbi:MAG: 4-(cytidine 5'-diphospho)-2-C-methyl-D-erythritol kinase [Deltaproteobacteria bacterium]|nr:4-(cytidine 5'-diphospho)-2-C-methyl-D-erythritol kinase [Deltaproteobacteria bacterium]
MPRQNPEEEAVLYSGCKINLYLRITGRLANGYHSLQSFMLPLKNPFDTLRISPGKQPGLTLICAEKYLDVRNNTLQKAYALFRPEAAACPDLKVVLEKNVPAGAGLGGGSADAAALLLFLEQDLEKTAGSGLGREKLLEIAAKVGMDVPFFILNQPAWVYGMGEKLLPCALACDKIYLVLVCPDIHVSTAWAYAEWDKMQLTRQQAQDTNLPFTEFNLQYLFNSFEQTVFACFPQLVEIKQKLFELGAVNALMSGSGSSLFGLFYARTQAKAAENVFKRLGFRVYTQAIIQGRRQVGQGNGF